MCIPGVATPTKHHQGPLCPKRRRSELQLLNQYRTAAHETCIAQGMTIRLRHRQSHFENFARDLCLVRSDRADERHAKTRRRVDLHRLPVSFQRNGFRLIKLIDPRGGRNQLKRLRQALKKPQLFGYGQGLVWDKDPASRKNATVASINFSSVAVPLSVLKI